MLTIGIDPGLTGAIAVLDHHGVPRALRDIPTMPIAEAGPKATVKTEIDVRALYTLLRELVPADESAICVMEHASSVGAKLGEQAKLSLAATKASILAVLRLQGHEVRRVHPITWKKHFGLTSDKNAALDLARSMYPGLAEIKRQKDHNRAESLLLARFGQARFA